MNTERQQMLQDLGLVEASETKVQQPQVVASNNNPMVGNYVASGKRYGMIDEAFSDGRFGFIYSEGDMWGSSLIDNPRACETKIEIERARQSARTYLEREKESLESRIKMHYTCDNQAQLAQMLWVVESWLAKMSA